MREVGFYWVKLKPDPYSEPWTVGHYDGTDYLPWQIVGSDEIFNDDVFEEIGPKIPQFPAQ